MHAANPSPPNHPGGCLGKARHEAQEQIRQAQRDRAHDDREPRRQRSAQDRFGRDQHDKQRGGAEEDSYVAMRPGWRAGRAPQDEQKYDQVDRPGDIAESHGQSQVGTFLWAAEAS